MSDSPAHTALLAVVGALLPTETLRYSWQAVPEAEKLPVYTELRSIYDVGLGEPLDKRTILHTPPTPGVKDMSVHRNQQRKARIRVFCYGVGAYARATTLAVGFDSETAKPHWGTTGISSDRQVTDASETLGNHHERVAFVDFDILYRFSVGGDVYSIQTLDFSLST